MRQSTAFRDEGDHDAHDSWQTLVQGRGASPREGYASPPEAQLQPDWQVAHRELTRLARSRAGLDCEEGRWLLAALRGGAHVRLGYGSMLEYVERLFGYGPRLTQEKLRVAEALEELPAMADALRNGAVCWSALRELTRVATVETEREWLDAACGRTAREVERLVSGHRHGSRPTDARDSRVERHVLRFEVSGEVLASFREALAKIRRDAGQPLDDDAALLLVARQVLGGPNDEGRSSYQVALTVCESCQRGLVQGRGDQVKVGTEVVEMALCDAQHIGHVGTHVGATCAPADENPAGDADARCDAKPPADAAGAPPPLPPDVARSAAAELYSKPNAHAGQKLERAAQDIPPAVRRLVLRRDGGSCVFPGCRHATFCDVHHLRPRSEGGRHDPNGLVTLCGAHHRAVHRGHGFIEGDVATGLKFRHADGSVYGARLAPAAADRRSKAFRALRGLGFGESEVRRVLAEVAHVDGDGNVESLVRRCLLTLTERAARAA